MKKYDIFDSEGKYRRSVECPNILDQLQDGEQFADADEYPSHLKRMQGSRVVRFEPKVADNTPALWLFVRSRRNVLLTACDWTQLPDVPEATAAVYRAYRQALRDVTNQPDPTAIVWPKPPQ